MKRHNTLVPGDMIKAAHFCTVYDLNGMMHCIMQTDDRATLIALYDDDEASLRQSFV